jgi:guanine deaminase
MNQHPNPNFMKRAIELSSKAGLVDKTGGVFGAVIVKDGKIIGEGYNRVAKEHDPTWHAEIEAIRNAAKKMGNPHLDGAILYTSAFCCPMCLCAAYWAQIKEIYYGARVEDAKKYGDFKDVDFYKEMSKGTDERLIKCKEFMRDEAIEVWKKFAVMPDRAKY